MVTLPPGSLLEEDQMEPPYRRFVLSCSVVVSSLPLAQTGLARSFTITKRQTVYDPKEFDTTGYTGTVEHGSAVTFFSGELMRGHCSAPKDDRNRYAE